MADDETVQFPQSDATTGFGVGVKTSLGTGSYAARAAAATASLQPGTVLGGRYEILQMLGEGGMGAVYKARDKAVDRLIALKIIRPDLVGNESILQRFKQELILARQVTHKNVIRIYDLGEADGLMFITMEYVEGQDLRSLLKDQGKLPVVDAVDITIQILGGLQSAHAEGVIHRDLKPGNIMRDPQGRIIVMDFGLARTLGGDGMTQTGMMLGTIEYMSPEQAQAKELDARSDLFTVGLIFYELISGATPFKAETALASLVKRTQERAVAVSTVEPTVDRRISAIIAKCLEREPEQRYQNAQQIIDDLENWKAGKAAGSLGFPSLGTWGRDFVRWEWIAVALAVIVLAIGGYLVESKLAKSPGKAVVSTPVGPEVSLAILPFRNASGDASLDWMGPSLAEMLTTDVGQSAHLRTVSANRLHQIFGDLKISSSTLLDPATIKRVAGFSSADRVVWGQYAKFGDQIRIDATLQDLKNDRTFPLKVDVASEKEIPGAIDKLAESIRQNLSLSQDLLKELKATSFQPASTSVDALRDYNQGVLLQRDGNELEAQKQFEAATKADPSFALAFSRLAQTYSSLGYDTEAEKAARTAVESSDALPEAEKYLITAIRAQVTKNYPEAIKSYENLAKAAPGNSDVQSALASLYEQTGDFTKAGEYYQKLLASNAKDITAVLATGRLAIKSGNPQASLEPLNTALSLAIQLDNQEQKSTALHLTGVAYRMLNKPEEALRNYQEALAIRRRLGQKRGIALSLNEIGKMQALQGNGKAAEASFKEALQIRRDIGDKRGIGDSLLDMGNFYDDRGDHDQALKMYKESLQIERDIGNDALQAVCLNNMGFIYSSRGQYDEALTFIQQALQLREKAKVPQDMAESVHNVAEISTRMGQYDDAIKNYMRALELYRSVDDQRGAAMESYGMGTLFGYQGRLGAAINAKQESLKAFQSLKDKSAWMADVSGGYGEALAQAGRVDEAKSYLDNALILARELKNDGLISQTLGFEGDAAYYRGDSKSANGLYDQALQAATRSKDSEKILIAKIDQSRLEVQDGRGKAAVPKLKTLMQQTEDAGLKNLAVECSIYMAAGMIQGHDTAQAAQELQRALSRSDKLGLQPLSARAHFLLATLPGESSESHYREVVRILDSMKKEPGAEKLLERSDFKAMYDTASHAGK